MERAFADADDCAASEPLASDPVAVETSPERTEVPMSPPLHPYENDLIVDGSGGGGDDDDNDDSALELLTPPPPMSGLGSRQSSPGEAAASVAVKGAKEDDMVESPLEEGGRSRGELDGGALDGAPAAPAIEAAGHGRGVAVDGGPDEADVTLPDLRLAASPDDNGDSPSPPRGNGALGGGRSSTSKALHERLAMVGAGSGVARPSVPTTPATPRRLDARAQAKVSPGYRGLAQIGVRTAVDRETRFLGSQM